MTATPAGHGSNQYATRGTSSCAGTQPRSGTAAVAEPAATIEDVDPDLVAWAFHPTSEPWRNAGVLTENEILAWARCRANPGAAREAIGGGLTSDEAQEWVTGVRLDLFAVYSFRHQGFTPEEARPRVEAGAAGTKAAQWRPMGESPEDASAWNKGRLPGGGFVWRHMTDLGPAKCKWWATNGFESPAEVSAWIAAALTDPREANRWRNLGSPPETCAGWIDAGFLPDETGWRTQGGQEAPPR